MTKTQHSLTGILMLAVAGTASAQTAKPPAPAAPPTAAPMAKPANSMAASAPAPAAKPAAAPKPVPSKELEAFMKPFEGSWKCETKFAANAFGPGSPEMTAKSSVKFKKDLDGFAYKGEYEIKKQKGLEMPMRGLFYMGFDPGLMQVVVTNVDNMGSIGMSTGKITGDTVTYSGEQFMMGMKVKTRETMGTKGPKEGFHKMEMDMGKGYMTFGEDTCKK
jgi:hypothetical protein